MIIPDESITLEHAVISSILGDAVPFKAGFSYWGDWTIGYGYSSGKWHAYKKAGNHEFSGSFDELTSYLSALPVVR